MNFQPALTSRLSQIVFASALAFLPIRAVALNFTPDASRVISDPSYLPLGGQLFGSTEYSNSQTNSTTNNSTGALDSWNTTLNNTITQLVEFGLTDDLTLRATGSYEWLETNTTPPAGAVTVTNSNGFSDTAFTALWRVLDEKDHPFNWDLTGAYTPNLINAESASPIQEGTVARGGASAAFGTALSYKTKSFTLYGSGTATCLDSRTILNPSNGTTTTFDSSWEYVFTLSTQTRFWDRWSLNAGLSSTFYDNQNASFVNAGNHLITFVDRPTGLTALTGSLNYQAVPNRFVVSLIYTHDFYGDGGNTYPAQPNSDTTITDKDENVLSGELRYLLF